MAKSGLAQALVRAINGVLALGLVFFGNAAFASQSARLVYARTSDAEGCGEEAALRQAVARRLGYDPFVAVSDNTVVAELRGDGSGLSARVFVIERGNLVSGARELSSKSRDCEELRLAVALAISIAIDPDAIERVSTDTSTIDSQAETTPATVVSEVPSPQPPPVSKLKLVGEISTRVTWRLGLAGTVATGPLPSSNFGFAGAFEVAGSSFTIGIEPRWLLPRKTDTLSSVNAQATTNFVGVTLTPCYRKNAFRSCYFAELGRLTSEGLVSSANRDTTLWVAQGLRLAYHLGREYGLGVTPKLDGLVAMNRVTMLLNGRTAYETPWVIARLSVEVNYAF